MKTVSDVFLARCHALETPDGKRYQVGYYSVEAHGILGKRTGALPDGRLASFEDARAYLLATCPSCDPSAVGQQVQDTMERVVAVAEPETYSTFFAVEMAISLGVGGACLLLTFPVVARRQRR